MKDMSKKRIDIEKLEAGNVIAKITDDEVAVVMRARNKINAIKSTIETLTDKLAREYEPINELWKKYGNKDVEESLLKRGLSLAISYREKCVKVNKISDDELKRALFHNLYW